jgi:ferrochelatase
MSSTRPGVLLLGFGGPEAGCCQRRPDCGAAPGCEAPCFVRRILGDDPAQEPRVAEVVEHYRHFGGFSPYNDLARQQAAAVRLELARRGRDLPATLGLRHWRPWTSDGAAALRTAGADAAVSVVLAPHRTKRSWDDYLADAAPALANAGLKDLGAVPPCGLAPGFIAAIQGRIREAASDWALSDAALLMTAHAIPVPAERSSPYRSEIAATAAAVANGLGFATVATGFQSAPSDSRVPWSSPLVADELTRLAAAGHRRVILCPIGFLVDHMEVLYDLDVEATQHALRLGLEVRRARCVNDHPAFISNLADDILAHLG